MTLRDAAVRPRMRRRAAAALLCAATVALLPAAATVTAGALPSAPTAAAEPAPVFTTPNTDACPHRNSPPPPIDSSEVPEPGETAPPPLPVPDDPIGGPRLDACGSVQPAGTPPLPDGISASGWVLADLDTGEVLAAKDPHGRHRPASTIKILLATLALQKLDLDTVLTATADEANVEGSRVGVGPGGEYTVHMLLRGLMMNSGNDAAQVLADRMGGTEATTAAMNTLARHLGALDTRTPTPSGLDGPGMSTSAYDLALLFRDAMQDPVFADLISHGPIEFPGYPKSQAQIDEDRAAAQARIAAGTEPIRLETTDPDTVTAALADAEPDPATGLLPPVVGPDGAPVVLPDHPGFAIANDNPLLSQYPGALGGKTGYTDDAGQTFIGAAERDGRRLVVTLLDGTRTPSDPWQQAAALLDYGFRLPPGESVGTLVEPGTVGPDGTADGGDTAANRAGDDGAVTLAAPPQSAQPGSGGSAHGVGYYAAVTGVVAAALLLAAGGIRLLRRRR
ncbi:D-alanyl-D-alanine carboxypeptidase family protein [Tomitella gaofuii]|uniref:D-alanyl-D-alanine carboxypeptidase family protein n=1 Tax=Tomitella gaofuii TaxID=2760083 RepID=UPI002E2BAA74|nr:D-alanyl-D-alanine carboxypeptidase family protein [Tomitella gaofuii]